MYSNQDRELIRRFLGFGALWRQFEPRLENAISSTQSIADGGSQPDSNTENAIKAIVYGSVAQTGAAPGVTLGPTAQNVQFAMPATIGLLAIEAQMSALWSIAFALQADSGEAKIDAYRGMVQLRSEGRRMAGTMALMLGMSCVRADVFSPGQPVIADDPFSFAHM